MSFACDVVETPVEGADHLFAGVAYVPVHMRRIPLVVHLHLRIVFCHMLTHIDASDAQCLRVGPYSCISNIFLQGSANFVPFNRAGDVHNDCRQRDNPLPNFRKYGLEHDDHELGEALHGLVGFVHEGVAFQGHRTHVRRHYHFCVILRPHFRNIKVVVQIV